MCPRQLFLAHDSHDADEVRKLALDLRLHGIVPWVDKQGGFLIGDDCEAEARRAIREDCFGLLLFATRGAFGRSFIRNVEIDEARKVKAENPRFALFAVPRDIGFDELKQLSVSSFGFDMSAFHTVSLSEGASLQPSQAHVAAEVVRRLLAVARHSPNGALSLQFSTRETLPDEPEDVLRIDATSLFAASVAKNECWRRVLDALKEVKHAVASAYGRPRLKVHGSKHLTAAFAFGRVFARFELEVRQSPHEVWHTDAPVAPVAPFQVDLQEIDPRSPTLFLQMATGLKNIGAGIDALTASGVQRPGLRLNFVGNKVPPYIDNGVCRAMEEQVYSVLDRTLQTRSVNEIHLFAAAPQSLMMMLGRRFSGMPPVCLYEWDGTQYLQSCRIPGGVL